MNELVVPPSPNWYCGSISACAPDNTVLYGSRHCLVIIKPAEPSEAADIKIIYLAHNDKVTGVSLCNTDWGSPDKLFVSISDDRIVKLWDLNSCSLVNQHKEHEKCPEMLVGVSMLKDRVVSVSELGYIIIWQLASNSRVALPDIFGQKVRIRCMSSCPHNPWRTAFGLYSGLVVIADLRKNGRMLYRLRGNEAEITSLTWCPATYNVFKTPKGVLIENSMKTKSEKGKYVDKKTDRPRKHASESQLKLLPETNIVLIRCESNDDKPADIDSSQVDMEMSNESFKNIITSGENGDLDDAPASTNLEYKPKQRKKNVHKPKVDKKNPWGNVQFNNSDDEEHTEDRRGQYLPAVTDDFLGECLNLRNIILREDSSGTVEKDSSSHTEVITEEIETQMMDRAEPVLEEGSGDLMVPEKEDELPADAECSLTEAKLDSTVEYEGGSGDAMCTEMECKITETLDKPVIADNELEPEGKEIKDDPVATSSSDLTSVTDSLQQLEIQSSETEPYIPEVEYLLASACKSGTICIWRAGTDGRIQLQLQAGNKTQKSHRSYHRNDKSLRWISLCWIKPDLLVTSSPTNEVYSWNLLPDIDTEKKLTKDSIFRPRLIHSDHRRNIFSIVTPYKQYSYNDLGIDGSDLHVWTTSQDRWILCTSLGKERQLLASYPTNGGFVGHMAASPVDPNKIAIGVGDSSIRIWDLSKPQTQVITMSCLWEKIKSKVLHLDWHPKKENFVAFSTAEGRVGEFDVCSITKPPVIFSNYHRNSVHMVQWGPLPNSTDGIYGLYSSSNGELVLHDASKPTIVPTKISIPECGVSTFAWKSDYSVLAVGTREGHVKLLSKDLVPYRTLYMQRKTVQCVAWHPISTTADTDVSPYANDLAVATNDSNIFVYRCDGPEQPAEDEDSAKAQLVAILQGHMQRVRNLAWCPHVAGRLASCSEDGTAMVWDVPSQTMLATFNEHCNDVILTVLWSPLDADLVLTGGKDGALRIWRVTKNPPDPSAINCKKEKKKPAKLPKVESGTNETQPDASVVDKSAKTCVLPCVTKMQRPDHGFSMDTFRKLLHRLDHPDEVEVKSTSDMEEDSSDDEEDVFIQSGLPEFKIDPVQLFGSKKDMMKILEFEHQTHIAKKRWDYAHHISLYKGDIAKSIRTALKAGIINPWIISMAPMVSIRLWTKLCVTYAEKLAEDGDGQTASSYFLAVHKVDRAIDALCKSNMHREALGIAKCRFPNNTDLIHEIIEKWAVYATYVGNFEIAAQCYINIGKLSEAGQMLNRRTDIESLEMAAELATRGHNQDLYDAIQVKLDMLRKQAPPAQEALPAENTIVNICPSRLEAVLAQQNNELESEIKGTEADVCTSSSSCEDKDKEE